MEPAQLEVPQKKLPDLFWRLLPVALFLPLFVILGYGLQTDPSKVPSPFINQPAPQFSLPQLANHSVEISPQDLHGQVWLLNVWASWCIPCAVEHPLLSTLTNVPIVGLNYKDEHADATSWLAERGDPYLFSLVDAEGRVSLDWGVYGVPETFVIDAAGIIRYKHIGPLDSWVIEEELMPLVKKLQQETS